MVRYTVEFTGRVQGVGFRYTTVNVARRFAVAGYVQNLPNGRVRLEAEGEAKDLAAFVDAVIQAMSRHIDKHTITHHEASGEFGSPQTIGAFTVRY